MVMLNKLERFHEQWGGYSDVIDYWLTLRQELLVDYYNIAGLSAGKKKSLSLPDDESLHRFCELLVDYISAGHFKIYNMVMERWQATGFSTNKEIDALYFRIVSTTEPLLNFSEKYGDISLDEKNSVNFDNQISSIGELLEERFEHEDSLIQLIAESLSVPPGA
ncbi:sigma D regulator [Parasalinivibrio latis]|uniref:sigma D regulator n=1 Tax=Parasalinivibrio latis TaxID=2952610 RepID=UPI0030E21BA7